MVIAATFLLAAAASTAAEPPRKLTLEQAVQQVKRDTDGHVLSADSVRSGRNNKYRIKVLTSDGRVRVVEVDSEPKEAARSNDRNSRNKETH